MYKYYIQKIFRRFIMKVECYIRGWHPIFPSSPNRLRMEDEKGTKHDVPLSLSFWLLTTHESS